jgi:predicted lipoprotein with Yx(FWY)xxD motif
MRSLQVILGASAVAGAAFVSVAFAAGRSVEATKDYIEVPMPPGFQVIVSELEGPVFADAQGRTLYKWPKRSLRNGDAGEIENKPTCGDKPYRENAGLMSPYPAGLTLPDADTRPACTQVWPPVLAPADAKPVGKWTIVDRLDGRKQWAYDEWSLYTSALDKQPGDVLGASDMFGLGEGGAQREPVSPKPNVPPQFAVATTMTGRMVTLEDGWSVYSFDGDKRDRSACYNECLDEFTPILAADYARPVGEWTTFERTPGVKQWSFRGKPVYRRRNDPKTGSQDGSDVPGWRNVYMQRAPSPPKGFVMKETIIGLVLGDANGKSLYRYVCTDDAFDQLACDHPDAPQIYRITICGGGDVQRCLKAFPYVQAASGTKIDGPVWSTMYIDPNTGKHAKAGQPGALNVWAFRKRPVYTYEGDKGPTDINAQAWGEFNGQRNGFRVIAYRDIYSNRDR